MDFSVPYGFKAMMDGVVIFTGVLRLLLILLVFLSNCYALFKVCFKSNLCMHNMVSTAVILVNLIYLITWPPFIVYSLSNGTLTLLNEQVYCLSQNYVVNAMGMVFLSLLTVRICDRTREVVFKMAPLTGTQNAAITFLMWILPQLLYDLISLTGSHRMCGRNPVFHFLSEIVRVVPRDSPTGYTLGFMVCEQELTQNTLSVHVWQYLVIVLPMAAIVLVGILMQVMASVYRRHNRRPNALWTPLKFGKLAYGYRGMDDLCRVRCLRRMVVVDLILCSNLFWHLIGRPLMLLHALLYRDDAYPAGFLDVGSHMMLAISCVFIPTVCAKQLQFGNGGDVVRMTPPLLSLVGLKMAAPTPSGGRSSDFLENAKILDFEEKMDCDWQEKVQL